MIDRARLKRVLELSKKARQSGLFAVLGKDGPGSGIADLGLLRVSGADAASFLHSQLTNEVNALKPGEGNLSARVTRTGALLRYFSLHALPEKDDPQSHGGFMLILEREGIASLQADLEKFAIADDVLFENVSGTFDLIAIQGPKAPEMANAVMFPSPPRGEGRREQSERGVRGETPELQSASAHHPSPPAPLPGGERGADEQIENSVKRFFGEGLPAGSFAFTRSLTGDPGFLFAMPNDAEARPVALKRIAETARKLNIIYLEKQDLADVLEMLRVEAGWARVGIDAAESKLVLPETGMEQHLVSYSKGCYLGQEVIARIRTYGSVPNVLRGLHIEGGGTDIESWAAALEKIPDLNAELMLEDGKVVGRIASRAISPVLEAPVAFAYLDRTHRTPGTVLKLYAKGGGTFTARVSLLPFYRAADTQSRVAFLHDRAIRLFAQNQDAKAVELLEEALRLDPTFADGYEALGVIMGRTGRFLEAIDIFKRLEEVAPNEPMVHTNLSLYYMKIGDKTAAEDEKSKATVKQFSRFGAMKKDQKREAEEEAKKKIDAERKKKMFEEVIEIDPEDPIALFGLGNALSALGDWAGAEKALSKACNAQKDNSAAYLAHGKSLEMLSREADAVAVYKTGMAVASKKGDLMPLKEMERRVLLLQPGQ